MPTHPSYGSKWVCVNAVKFSTPQPKSNSRVAPQPLVMVLENHEFSISQGWPFVANNTTNFRSGCQIQKSWGERCDFTNVIGVSVMLHQL